MSMTRYEKEFYEDVKKIKKHLESMAHSLEILAKKADPKAKRKTTKIEEILARLPYYFCKKCEAKMIQKGEGMFCTGCGNVIGKIPENVEENLRIFFGIEEPKPPLREPYTMACPRCGWMCDREGDFYSCPNCSYTLGEKQTQITCLDCGNECKRVGIEYVCMTCGSNHACLSPNQPEIKAELDNIKVDLKPLKEKVLGSPLCPQCKTQELLARDWCPECDYNSNPLVIDKSKEEDT